MEINYKTAQTAGRKLDFAYILLKLSRNQSQSKSGAGRTCGLTGFNTILRSNIIPAISRISNLPVINISQKTMAIVATNMSKSVSMVEKLGLKDVVIIMGQVIYYKGL